MCTYITNIYMNIYNQQTANNWKVISKNCNNLNQKTYKNYKTMYDFLPVIAEHLLMKR